MRRPRLVYVVTHPVTADLLLRGQLEFMREHGFDVTVISSPGEQLERVRERERVATIGVPMAREIDVARDARSLVEVTRAMRRVGPDIVNAGTPKAGLLGMMAARALSIPLRIYLLRGLRLETTTGATRTILGITERIASSCAHEVACVSRSLQRAVVDAGYVPAAKTSVVGAGSSNGVDAERFRRTDALRGEGARRLRELGVRDGDPVIAFVGRLAVDKGIDELLDAFVVVQKRLPNAKLLLLGGDLAGERVESRLTARATKMSGVISTPTIADVAPYYARIDVLAFPSYREGFPNVALEAAAAEVPVVGFRSTGVVDAVESGVTGELVDRDAGALSRAVLKYLESPALAEAHGRAARERVERLFTRRAVWEAWLALYRSRLEQRGIAVPRGTERS